MAFRKVIYLPLSLFASRRERKKKDEQILMYHNRLSLVFSSVFFLLRICIVITGFFSSYSFRTNSFKSVCVCVFVLGNRQYTHNRSAFISCRTNERLARKKIVQPTDILANKQQEGEKKDDRVTMKKFIHLKRIMIESGEEYGLGFPASPKTPNTVSHRLLRAQKMPLFFSLALQFCPIIFLSLIYPR